MSITGRAGKAALSCDVTVFPRIARIEVWPSDTTAVLGDTLIYRALAHGTDGLPLPEAPVVLTAHPVETAEGTAYVADPVIVTRSYTLIRNWPPRDQNARVFSARTPGTGQVLAYAHGFEDSTSIKVMSPK